MCLVSECQAVIVQLQTAVKAVFNFSVVLVWRQLFVCLVPLPPVFCLRGESVFVSDLLEYCSHFGLHFPFLLFFFSCFSVLIFFLLLPQKCDFTDFLNFFGADLQPEVPDWDLQWQLPLWCVIFSWIEKFQWLLSWTDVPSFSKHFTTPVIKGMPTPRGEQITIQSQLNFSFTLKPQPPHYPCCGVTKPELIFIALFLHLFS